MGLIFDRYVVLVAGMYFMSVAGSVYLFGVFATDLQVKLHYSDTQIALVGTLENVGTWLGVVPGLFYDKFGPQLTSLVGAILIFLGYFGMYLGSIGVISQNVLFIGISGAIMGQGSGWAYTSALNTNIKNFASRDRGKIVGILVCFYGLCGAIYTQIYRGFFQPNVSLFILFMAITFSSVVLFFGCLLTVQPNLAHEEANYSRINMSYILAIFVAIYLGVANIAETYLSTSRIYPIYFAIPLIFMMVWFLYFPFCSNNISTIVRYDHDAESKVEAIEDDTILIDSRTTNNSDVVKETESNLLQTMQTLQFWLLFFAFIGSIGSGVTTVNTIGKVVISRENYPTDPIVKIHQNELKHAQDINTFVALFSVCNMLGRIFIGFVSDKFINKFDRFSFLIMAVVLMGLTQLILAFASVELLYLAVVLLGISYGGIFCMMPTITSELFGSKYFGANYGLMSVAPALGSIFFNTLLASFLSNMFLENGKICILDQKNICSYQCLGYDCYRYTYLILCGVCFLAIACLLTLKWMRRQRKYPPLARKV